MHYISTDTQNIYSNLFVFFFIFDHHMHAWKPLGGFYFNLKVRSLIIFKCPEKVCMSIDEFGGGGEGGDIQGFPVIKVGFFHGVIGSDPSPACSCQNLFTISNVVHCFSSPLYPVLKDNQILVHTCIVCNVSAYDSDNPGSLLHQTACNVIVLFNQVKYDCLCRRGLYCYKWNVTCSKL